MSHDPSEIIHMLKSFGTQLLIMFFNNNVVNSSCCLLFWGKLTTEMTYNYHPLSFQPIGASFAVPVARPHCDGDEGRDHSKTEGAELRPGGKH